MLELIMSERDLVETRPDARYRGMPLAMIVLRRALWANPRERATDPASMRVTFSGQQRVHPIIGDRY